MNDVERLKKAKEAGKNNIGKSGKNAPKNKESNQSPASNTDLEDKKKPKSKKNNISNGLDEAFDNEESEDDGNSAVKEAIKTGASFVINKLSLKAKLIILAVIAIIFIVIIIIVVIVAIISSVSSLGSANIITGNSFDMPKEIIDSSVLPLKSISYSFGNTNPNTYDISKCYDGNGIDLTSTLDETEVYSMMNGTIMYASTECPSSSCKKGGVNFIIEHYMGENIYLTYYSSINPNDNFKDTSSIIGTTVQKGTALGTIAGKTLHIQIANGEYTENGLDKLPKYNFLSMFSGALSNKDGFQKCNQLSYSQACPFVEEKVCASQYQKYYEKTVELQSKNMNKVEKALIDNALSLWLKVRYCAYNEDHYEWYWNRYSHCACRCGNEIILGKTATNINQCNCNSIEKTCSSGTWQTIFPYMNERSDINSWNNLCANGEHSQINGPGVYDATRDCQNKWGQWGVHAKGTVGVNLSWQGYKCNGVTRYVGLDCGGFVQWVMVSSFKNKIEYPLNREESISATKEEWKKSGISIYQYVDEFNNLYTYNELLSKAKSISNLWLNQLKLAQEVLKIADNYDYQLLPYTISDSFDYSLIPSEIKNSLTPQLISTYGLFYTNAQYKEYIKLNVNAGVKWLKSQKIYEQLLNNKYNLEELTKLKKSSNRAEKLIEIFGNYNGINAERKKDIESNQFTELLEEAKIIFKYQGQSAVTSDPASLNKQELIDALLESGALKRKNFLEKITYLENINIYSINDISLTDIAESYISSRLKSSGYDSETLEQILSIGINNINNNASDELNDRKIQDIVNIISNYQDVSSIKYQTENGLETIISIAQSLLLFDSISEEEIKEIDNKMQNIINASYIRPGDAFSTSTESHAMMFLGYDDDNFNNKLDGDENAYLIHSTDRMYGVMISPISLENLAEHNLRTYNYDAIELR